MIRLLGFSALFLFGASQGFEIHPRIINGVKSNVSDFPFYVYLESEQSKCGGVLIDNKWVVTAAHCITCMEDIDVYKGIDVYGGFSKVIAVGVQNQHIHPGYDNDTHQNDIALLELPIPAELTPNIQIAKVPTDCQSLHEGNENVIAIGTGRNTINQTRYIKIILQQVEFTTLSSDDCGQVARGMNQRALVCVNSESGESILNGDSGGPLIKADDGTVIGITNFFAENKNEDDPQKRFGIQGFANLRYHFKWISRVTGLELPKCRRSLHDEFMFKFVW